MAKIGAFIFRNRSYAPIPMLLLAVFWNNYNPSILNITLGLLFIVLGELGRIYCVSYAGGITRTRTGDLKQLISSGPFAYVRNPIYISNIVMYSGSAFLLGAPELVPFSILYFAIEYIFIVAYEEKILINEFGQEYINYCDKVNRWLPKCRAYKGKNVHSPVLNEALKAEKSTFISIGSILIIAIIKFFIRA